MATAAVDLTGSRADAAWSVLPIAHWLPRYERQWLRTDVVAGISTWAVVVPQAVAYTQIAGLPPQAGFAAAFAGPFGYALLGTCRQLMVSPTSSGAALSLALIAPIALGDPQRFVSLSAALAVLTGLVLVVMGVLKLGFVSQFLSNAVQTGFMIGLGLTIAVGQGFKLLGLTQPAEADFLPTLWALLAQLAEVHGLTALLGIGGLALLVMLKQYAPRAPAVLIVVALGTIVTALFGLSTRGVATVGAIPPGLPPLTLPAIEPGDIRALLPAALAISVIGYAETASVAQGFATRHRYDIRPDQELLATGGSNVLAGLFQGFMVAGGASQSAANDRAGARTQVSSLVVAGLAVATAVWLTPIFVYLPQAILAAIVIDAVRGFLRFGELRRIARLRRDSFLISICAMVSVLLLGMLPGLLLSIGVSVLLLLGRLARPTVSTLERVPHARAYDEAGDVVEVTLTDTLILRPDLPLLFTNARTVRTLVVQRVRATAPPPRVLLLDLEACTRLDIEGSDTLVRLRDELASLDVRLWLTGVRAPLRAALEHADYFSRYQPSSDGVPTSPVRPGTS